MPKTRKPLIAHLKGREKLLEPLGFTPQQAEWITLVCLHSGLFTRDQAGAFLRLSRAYSDNVSFKHFSKSVLPVTRLPTPKP